MLLISFASILILILFGIVFIGYTLSAPVYKGPKSDHFNGKTFINPAGIKAKGLVDVLRWALSRKRGPWTKIVNPISRFKRLDPISTCGRITFVNHSTFLIQTQGLNILTDPVWSERVSPFSWAGPKRMRPPGISFEDLPNIDLILITHNHYDHLDMTTMKKLIHRYNPKIITPLGVKAFLDKNKLAGAHDLDWWGEFTWSDSLKILSVPAQHFSGRGSFDRDATLWCGYVIKTPEKNIYYVGDTGYNDTTFKEIGEKVSPINISIIPIGAYLPKWFMSPIHVCPEEAVKIHLDLKSHLSIGTHFGTFMLADEAQYEPFDDLEKAKAKYQLASDSFITLPEGVCRDF